MLLQARRLSVQNDMQPVCDFFQSQGLSEQEVIEVGLDIALTHHTTLKLSLHDNYGIIPFEMLICRWFLNTLLF